MELSVLYGEMMMAFILLSYPHLTSPRSADLGLPGRPDDPGGARMAPWRFGAKRSDPPGFARPPHRDDRPIPRKGRPLISCYQTPRNATCRGTGIYQNPILIRLY